MNANDWKSELDRLLGIFARESTISLREINRCFIATGRAFDENFRQYFMKMSTLELDKCFNTVLFERCDENPLQMSPNPIEPTEHCVSTFGNEIPASTSSNVDLRNKSNLLDMKIENSVDALIEIVDSEDEDAVEVQRTQTGGNNQMQSNSSQEANNHASDAQSFFDEQDGTNPGDENVVEVIAKDEPKVENDIEMVDLPLVEFDPNQHNDCSTVGNGTNVAQSSGNQNQLSSSSNVPGQMKRSTLKRFECNDCSYTSQYKSHINHHQRMHAQQKLLGVALGPNVGQYKCPHCDEQFIKWNSLRSHLTRSHKNRQRLFNCSRCMRRFARKNEKEQHETQCQARRYECYLCKKYVTVKVASMHRHMRTHSGARPFKCAVCKKCFRQKGGLRRHLNSIHKPIEH